MPNWIYQKLLEEQIQKLINAFDISEGIFKKSISPSEKKLFHPGEFGTYRETIVIEFLRFITPRSLAITNGFVITPNNKVSSQCDIIIYDINSIPLVQDSNKDKFIPIESVVAIGEIKSTLTLIELKNALSKLSKVKKYRSELSWFGPL